MLLLRLRLDAAVPDHPVRVEHRGGHTSYVNSLAFKMADVSDNTPDPPGGRFERDPSGGGLSGRVSESARIKYVLYPASREVANVTVTPAEVQQYYTSHQSQYTHGEQREAKYLIAGCRP